MRRTFLHEWQNDRSESFHIESSLVFFLTISRQRRRLKNIFHCTPSGKGTRKCEIYYSRRNCEKLVRCLKSESEEVIINKKFLFLLFSVELVRISFLCFPSFRLLIKTWTEMEFEKNKEISRRSWAEPIYKLIHNSIWNVDKLSIRRKIRQQIHLSH